MILMIKIQILSILIWRGLCFPRIFSCKECLLYCFGLYGSPRISSIASLMVDFNREQRVKFKDQCAWIFHRPGR